MLMNIQYLAQATQHIANHELLINVVSRRVRQLTQGSRPLIALEGHMDPADIALKEICEGKIGFEILDTPETAEAAPA